jgi:hypothetical protein
MRLFWDVAQCRTIDTGVSGEPVGPSQFLDSLAVEYTPVVRCLNELWTRIEKVIV